MNRPFLLSGIFIIGCATGGVASQLVVPSAQANANTGRWEHWCAKSSSDENLKKSSAAGWEMVSSTVARYDVPTLGGAGSLEAKEYTYCFKRSVAAP